MNVSYFNIKLENIKSIRLLGYILLTILPFSTVSGQSKANVDIISETGLERNLLKDVTELIYLQTNKGIYEAGEDLWFKAYILDAQYLVPSGLSQTLYLQLVNEKSGKAYWQEIYEIQKRFAAGHVYLPDTLPEGNYLLEAFTPHSFFKNSSEFESCRRIVVRKDLKPHVTIKTEFTRLSYGKDDSIGVIIHALSEQAKPLYAEISAELKNGDKILEKVQTKTNEDGTARIIFDSRDMGTNLKIKIEAKHTNVIETLELAVPYHEGSLIQFSVFPEGGYLVSELVNTLAFKAVNVNGEPVQMEGTLFEDGDSLLNLKSYHAGMGSFDFVPDKNKKYHIRLLCPRSDSLWQLPEIKEKGIVFHLARRDSNFLYFSIKQKSEAEQRLMCLRGQMRGNIYCLKSGELKEELEIKVPENVFPQQGIVEFTLLDKNLTPIAERLVYVNPENKLHINAELSKEKYSLREKATLKLKVMDEDNQPVVAHLGVTVFDKIYQNWQDAKNIFTHCYLSTQLKGRIYDPLYYFETGNNNRLEALDLLLLTQGWRRYVWNEQTINENETNHEQVIFDGVKGRIVATKKLKNAPKGYQMMAAFNPSVNDNKYRVIADSTGKFEITPSLLSLGQGGHVYLQTLYNEMYEYKLTTDFPFDTIFNTLRLKNVVYPSRSVIDIQVPPVRLFTPGPDIFELGEITIEGKQKHQFRDKYMGHLDSLAKAHFDPGDYVGPCGILNCPIHKGDYRNTKPIEGEKYQRYAGFEWVGKEGGAFTTGGIERIEYHYPVFTEDFLLKMNNIIRVKGYYIEREFYQPNYDVTDSLDFIPDYRNTLLWVPNVLTDQNGEATIEFFCSDIYTDFVGVIEGVSGDGKLGNKTFDFKVLKTGPFNWEK